MPPCGMPVSSRGFRVAAGLGYRFNYSGLGEVTRDNPGVNGPEPEQFIASGSVLHVSSGLFLTGAYVNQDNDIAGRPDTTLWYAQAGISKNWTGLGKTVLYGEYARVEDGCRRTSRTLGSTQRHSGHHHDSRGVGPRHRAAHRRGGHGGLPVLPQATAPSSTTFRRRILDINDFDMVVGGARIRF